MQGLLYIHSAEVSGCPGVTALPDPQSVTHWGAMFAMATLSLVPVFIIFITFQRQ